VRELLDYGDLIDLTRQLTRHEREVEEMFRRAVFNIAIANDDDHSRNHAFLMDPRGDWTLSPAYDLTRSSYALGSGFRAGGIRGRFSDLSPADLRALGAAQAIRRVDDHIAGVLDTVRRWPEFASRAGLSGSRAAALASEMPANQW
jgi:serine/threonine-protein kinase HipA